MAKPQIAIVGAGIAGLTTAVLLGPHAQVTVYERSREVGGKIKQLGVGNRRVDSGPTVFTMKPLFERIFRICGEKLDDHLSLEKLPILARHFWQDGSTLDLFADRDRALDAVKDFAGKREADALAGFFAMAERTWETLYDPMIEQEGADFARLLATTPPHRLVRLNPYTTLWKELSRRFKDPRLRQLFGRYATYCGSSPFEAPGVLSIITHVERQGVWTIDGGMTSLAEALHRVAMKRGVTFAFGAEIDRIEAEHGRATGVVNGVLRPADGVVFNGDIAALPGALEEEPSQPPARSLSAVTMCTEGHAEGAPLSYHNVFFSKDYQSEFETLFRTGCMPDDPTVYLHAPDTDQHTDTEQRFMALINAPPNGDSVTYSERERSECRSRILDQLKRCGVTLMPDPQSTQMTTPTDFARRFPATGGALYGRPTHGWRASFQRPGIRTRTKGLYCAGGSVHPGSGVPMAALSGLMAARAVIQDYRLT
jgi:1-hydroxycarotenoid 3,4-desaturase